MTYPTQSSILLKVESPFGDDNGKIVMVAVQEHGEDKALNRQLDRERS